MYLRYKAYKKIFRDFFKYLEVPGIIIQIKNLKMINTIEFIIYMFPLLSISISSS